MTSLLLDRVTCFYSLLVISSTTFFLFFLKIFSFISFLNSFKGSKKSSCTQRTCAEKMASNSHATTQLIAANGEFNANGLKNFVNSVKLQNCGLSYAVVAIMGPQSSGKSTLLNHLFYTNFREMDAFKGRNQTTKGVWISKAVGIEPFTIVMDLEGTDGRERGEDDTTFEKQSALFALAVADIVLINMWCHDIGREHAANKPLLKTVFQVMMRLFTPRKTTLLFVIRDKTKTPFQYLEPILREDIQKIWESVRKPQQYKDTPLSEFFNVEVTALSSYEEKEKQFKEQVSLLRKRFFNSISPGGLAGDRRGVVPASGFSLSAEKVWTTIKENKDLDLPAHKVMVATVRCEEIANEKFNRLACDEDWLALAQAVQTGVVIGFGKTLSSFLKKYLSEYDTESLYFEESVRNVKRQYLVSKALQLVHPAYITMLGHLRSNSFHSFQTQLEECLSRGEGFAASARKCQKASMLEFDQGCSEASIEQANWDASKVREKLRRDIEAHTSVARNEKLSELTAESEKRLFAALSEPLDSLFDTVGPDTWASVRRLLDRESDAIVSDFSAAVAGFELDQATMDEMMHQMKEYARKLVERKAREEAGKLLVRMKDRFSTAFNHDKDSLPRVWTGKEDIRSITKEARLESLKLLSTMAAIRLDNKRDNVENVLISALMGGNVPDRKDRGTAVSGNPLASSKWEEIAPENTLITPVQCKNLWRQFETEIEYMVTQAISAQMAYTRGNNWIPPPWAIVAMIFLGFNEFMFLLRNPHYLLACIFTLLLVVAAWIQTNFLGEFRNGIFYGLVSLTTKYFPAFLNLLARLVSEGHESSPATPNQPTSRIHKNQSQQVESVLSSVQDSFVSSNVSSGSETYPPQEKEISLCE